MTDLRITVDGNPVSFQQVWVHLKTKAVQGPACRIEVPTDATQAIFDPYGTKPEQQSWKDFLSYEVSTFGTCIVEHYLRKMAEMRGDRHTPRLWVLTTISEIEESETRILLTGTVEGFRHHNLVPKELN